jgi:FtsH-binding integral membrane protein
LVGVIGGMLYGALQGKPMMAAILVGGLYGSYFAMAIAQITLIVAGFKEKVWWGLIVWFVPLGSLVFIIQNWAIARKTAFQLITAIVLFMIFVIAVAVTTVADAAGGAPGV